MRKHQIKKRKRYKNFVIEICIINRAVSYSIIVFFFFLLNFQISYLLSLSLNCIDQQQHLKMDTLTQRVAKNSHTSSNLFLEATNFLRTQSCGIDSIISFCVLCIDMSANTNKPLKRKKAAVAFLFSRTEFYQLK